MNKILEKIGQILGIETLNFEEVKDSTGNIIRIDKYEIGSKAELISTDGTLIPLTDGDYELEDGRKFTIVGGLISAINEATSPEAAPAVEVQPIENALPVAEETPAAPVEPEDDVVCPNMEERMAKCETSLEELKVICETMMGYMETMASSTKEFNEVKKQLQKDKEELSAKVGELEKQPAGNPVVLQAVKTEENSETDYAARYTAFRNLNNKNKK